jgi:hypothetical protein
MKGVAIIFLLLFALGCNQKSYYVKNVDNPEFRGNTAFVSFEDVTLPKFEALKVKYKIDTVFHGEQDEFKRILLLRNWIRKIIKINDYCKSYPGDGSPESILDEALKGQGFHCGHFMVVQNAVMNAYGYVTRCLGSGPGVNGVAEGHHGFNEIWLNKYHKWFLSDAKYDHHFEKNGIPLSALEVRDEYLKNQAKEIVLVKGPNRTPIDFDGVADKNGKMIKVTKAGFAQMYTWLEWDKSNNRYSIGPGFNSKLNWYQDDYAKNHTWFWDGKPHWAYHTAFIDTIYSANIIEWTPNTIHGNVVFNGHNAVIKLASITPNLKGYEMRHLSSGKWIGCDSVIKMRLKKSVDTLFFRTCNLENVCGAEYKIVVALK